MNQAIETKKVVRISLFAIGALFLLLILMSTVFKISGAVIASGDVGVEGSVKEITHPTGGVVSEVLVQNGDEVEEGQVLVRLDTSVSDVSSSSADQSLQVMLARRARLEAERDGQNSYQAPEGVSDAAILGEEEKLFALRRQSLAESHAQMRERMTQIQQGALSIEAQIRSVTRQRELFEKERQGIQSLYDRGLVTLPRYTQTERTAVDLEAQEQGLRAQLAQSQAQLAEVRQQNSQLDQNFRSEAGNQLASLDAQLADARTQAASRSDQHQRNEIRAPYDGVVDKLAYTTIGSYLPASQLVLEIVPTSDRRIIEVQIAPQDIDQVAPGQEATLHFSAFSQQTTPTIPGEVEWVSAERSVDQGSGVSFYRAHVGVSEEDFARLEGLQVKVGMPVEAYIQTGSRTIMSYLLKPLTDQMERAFR